MRILFIASSRIGDAVISCGILEHLRRTYPEAKFTVAVGVVAADVFARLPGMERRIVFDKERFDLHWPRLWAKLAFHVWDIVVDVRGSGLAIFLLARRRYMIRGGRRPGRRYEQLGHAMGLTPAPLPVAWTSPQDAAAAASLLPAGGLYIGLGPTSAITAKIWPPERFVALFKALAAEHPGARAVIFAGPGAAERALAAPVLAAIPGAIDLVGRLELPQAAACLRRVQMFIGNDSGLMHLAAAAGTPTLGLFGPSRADQYAPAGPRTATAIAPGPPGKTPIDRLTVEAVVQAARKMLSETP
jgi:ADP-heptose:LPS heptosyltransferase